MRTEAARQIDRLINIDVPGRGVIDALFQAATRAQPTSMCLAAARRLEAIDPGSWIIIGTGWTNRPEVSLSIAETDGPVGAALLARSLAMHAKAVPVVLIEAQFVTMMTIVLEAAGLSVLPLEEASRAPSSSAPIHAASVLASPTSTTEAEAQAFDLVTAGAVEAIVAIEKGGQDASDRILTTRGKDLAPLVGKVDPIVRMANEKGISTIGIGDAGNELGFGLLTSRNVGITPDEGPGPAERLQARMPATPVDVLVTAAVSNWGVTGILGCLWGLTGNAGYLHTSDIERRVFEAAARAGFIDGGSGLVTEAADGVHLEANLGMLELVRSLVRASLP